MHLVQPVTLVSTAQLIPEFCIQTLRIGCIRMDIDNPGYLGPRQTCKAWNVSML
jgi:hypothetical protein